MSGDIVFVGPDADRIAPNPAPHDEVPGGLIEGWFADLVIDHDLDRPRSRQIHIGPSEIGERCDRRLAMQLMGATPVNFPDPLKAYVGTGLHEMVADALRLRDRGTGRYLSEHRVDYRGVGGNVDIFDRVTGRAIDLKSKALAKIKRLRRSPMEHKYKIQQQVYAAGLIAQGEKVKSVSLLYVPVDGTLADSFAQTLPVDLSLADAAIDRIEALSNAVADGREVDGFDAHTSALCGWCPFYNPGAPLSSTSCPGGAGKALATPA